MDFGFSLPTRGPLASPEMVRTMAERGEALGYAYLAFPDHILVPKDIASRYPYSQSGAFPGSADGDSYEQLALMAWVAALTSKARLLTSIMVVPHRPAVFTAKALATIDQLSGGRVVVGCGVGWLEEEFVAVGAPPFKERGKVTDEYLRVFKELWTQHDPTFEGDYTAFSNITFTPKPLQNPHPPLWIGGESTPALRRTARLGDCWYPICNNPQFPISTPAHYAEAWGRLTRMAEEGGRDPAEIDQAFWDNMTAGRPAQRLDDGGRQIMTGSADEVAEDIAALGEHGVRHVLFNFQSPTLQETLDRMERYAGDILSRF